MGCCGLVIIYLVVYYYFFSVVSHCVTATGVRHGLPYVLSFYGIV